MSLTGVIARWNPKGYGFIECDADGEDLFVHKSQLSIVGEGAPETGTKVEFEVEEARGRPVAVRVTAPGGKKIGEVRSARVAGAPKNIATRLPVQQTASVFGKVKKWFDGTDDRLGGYGFVVPLNGEHTGRDIYIHHSAFGGGSLNIGYDINFDVEEDPNQKGKFRAINAAGPAVCGRGCRPQQPWERFTSLPERRNDDGDDHDDEDDEDAEPAEDNLETMLELPETGVAKPPSEAFKPY
ncbi:hypothetical protein DIPPA_21432 [Diplonema papillatum]|nr:hypothetical protein DIPPA_21432 [Diplonema papillatum]